jgi:predicted nucleotidyltransferase
MNLADLNPEIIESIASVFKRYTDITAVVLFGSRAKGTAKYNSDIDLAIFGIQEELAVEAISMELEELPLPYKFDVKAFDTIRNSALREHIKRVGIMVYEK